MDDFANHSSVLVIKNSALKQSTDFSFEPVSISYVANLLLTWILQYLLVLMVYCPKCLSFHDQLMLLLGLLQSYLIIVSPHVCDPVNGNSLMWHQSTRKRMKHQRPIIVPALSFQQSLRSLNSWSLTRCIVISHLYSRTSVVFFTAIHIVLPNSN